MMKRKLLLVLSVSLVIVAVVSLIGLISFSQQKSWVNVSKYNWADYWDLNLDYNDVSNNNVTTTQFKITGEEWRISWSCTGSIIVGNHFYIKVYDDYTREVVKEITTTSDNTLIGQSYLKGQGQYHLQIFSMGYLSPWQITVQEFR
jgi:uncharacterized protein YxeA